MIQLSKRQIIMLHDHLIDETGGSGGIRDEGLLEAAVNAPFQGYGHELFYPTIVAQAARLGFGLIENHPFLDGNKRIGTHAMLLYLAINGIELDYTQDELIQIILDVASGTKNLEDLQSWLYAHEKQ